MQRQRPFADAVGVGVQERDRILWAERRRGDACALQRRGAGQAAAVELDLALADQRQEELRHRAQIGLAQGADAAYPRMQPAVQHRRDGSRHGGRQSRCAVRQTGQPHEKPGAHVVGVEEVADADGARHHRLALEGRDLVRPQRGVDRGAEPGIQAVDLAIARGEALDDRPRPRETAKNGRREADRGAVPRHGDHIVDRRRPPAELDQRITPLDFRKAAATARGSFLSTSTWRLSSCMVGLSIRLPTFRSASTALGLPATVSCRTTGAR